MSKFTILPVGTPIRDELKHLCAVLSETLGAQARLADAPLDPLFSFLPERGQYHSTSILARIDELYEEYPGRVIGVTERDLCIPILTHVFGEAQVGGRAAVVSMLRLQQKFYGLPDNPGLSRQRLLKEALHEIGHTYGLLHCPDWRCVMHTSNTVDEIDIKGDFFCSACRRSIL